MCGSAKTDCVANFPLRGAPPADLGTALALCHRDFFWWHGQAVTIAQFPNDARSGGVESVLSERNRTFLDLVESGGYLNPSDSMPRLADYDVADRMTAQQLDGIAHSARIAAVVMLHNASDIFFWRLLRFAMVSERSKAILQIANRRIALQDVLELDRDALIDSRLEEWWGQCERQSLRQKWDYLVTFIGSPDQLRDTKWHFDRDRLLEFDEARHDCVHGSGTKVKSLDLDEFARLIVRAQIVWGLAIAKSLNVKVPARLIFGPEA